MELTEHKKAGKFAGWKKFVAGRLFHLGQDRRRADAIATTLVDAGAKLKASGGEWTDALVAQCYAAGAESLAAPTSTVAEPVTVSGMSLHQMIQSYLDSEKLRAEGNTLQWTSYHAKRDSLGGVKRYAKDVPLATLTLGGLRQMVTSLSSRPVSKATGKRISADYAANMVRYLRAALDWADAEGHWVAVRRWTDAFKGVSVKRLSTPLERRAKRNFATLSMRDAQIIWHAGLNELHAMMGLGLFTAQTAQELATLTLDDFVEDGGQLYVDRHRNKTGVHGRWWIPEEVAACVRKWLERTRRNMAKRGEGYNTERLAFLTREHRPLVHFGMDNQQRRSDAVKELWDGAQRFGQKYGCRWTAFKALRKTLSQEVRTRMGKEYSELFCAHSPSDINDEHYTGASMAKLEKCVREEVYPAWTVMFSKPDLAAIAKELEASKKSAA